MAVGGLGQAPGEADDRSVARSPVSPIGCRRAGYRLAQTLQRPRQRQLASASPTALTASSPLSVQDSQDRFDRPVQASRAPPKTAERRYVALRQAAEGARPGARLDQHAGRTIWDLPKLAAAARRARRSPSRPLSRVGGRRAAHRRNFPPFMRSGRASAEAPRLSRDALVAAPRRGRRLPAADAGRQGRVLRQRRPRYQAGRRHGADEEGHGRLRPWRWRWRTCS